MIVEKLTALFDLDATGFNAGMKKAKKNLDSARGSMNQTSMSVVTLGKSLANTASSIALATSGMLALGAATLGVTVKLAEMAAEVEALEKGLKFAAGGARQGREAFKFLSETSDRLGVSLEKGGKAFKLIAAASLGTALEGEKVRDIYLAIAEASAVVGLSQFQSERVFYAVQQMMSKGVISAEELRQQMGEHLPMAFNSMAKSLGITTAELNKMMSMGVLMAEDVLPAFAKTLREDLADSVEAASTGIRASLARLSNAWYEAKREIFSGETASGLQKALEWMTEIVKELPKHWRKIELGVMRVWKVTVMLYDIVKDTLMLFIKLTAELIIHLKNVSNAIFEFLISPLTLARKAVEAWKRKAGDIGAITDALEDLGDAAKELNNLPKSDLPFFGDDKEVLKKAERQAEAVRNIYDSKFSNLRLQLKFERLEAANSAESEFEKAKIVIEKRLQSRLALVEKDYKARLVVFNDNKIKEVALTKEYNDLIADIQLTADKQLGAARLQQMKAQQQEINRMFEQNYGSVIAFVGNSVKKMTDTLVDMSMGGKKSFKEMVDSIISDMQKLVYQIFVIEPIIKAFRKLLQEAIPSGEGMLGMFSGEGNGGSLIKNLFGMAKNIFGFASGGTIREPVAGIGLRTGSGYTLGENGPETVSPAGSSSTGAITVNISALDSKSLVDLMENNPQAVLNPLVGALQAGDRGVSSALRGAI